MFVRVSRGCQNQDLRDGVLSEWGFGGCEDLQDGLVGGMLSQIGRRLSGQLPFDRLPPQRIWDRTNGCGRDARAPMMAPTELTQAQAREPVSDS